MRPGKLAAEAKQVVAELTGFRAETVSALSRNGEGWIVTVEALELKRVPSTMDVMGSYEVHFSDDGEFSSIQRRHRYPRASTEEDLNGR